MIRNLTVAYFGLVKKTVSDAVPKAIKYLLIDKLKSSMQSELISQLYQDHTFNTLVSAEKQCCYARPVKPAAASAGCARKGDIEKSQTATRLHLTHHCCHAHADEGVG